MVKVFIRKIYAQVYGFLYYAGELSILFGQTVRCLLSTPLHPYRFLWQARRVGLGSVFIASLVGLSVGMIIALQMAYMMVKLSAEIYIPNVIAVSIARELGPVLTALIVAGRIGAGITAEIGTMVVTEQIDALRAFAVDPIRYLVAPRFLALVIMLPVLTLFAVIVGIFGGFLICFFKLSISAYMYWEMVKESLVIKDIVTGLTKTVFFGMIIAIVGCYEGLHVKGGADGVGASTTLAVVRSFILIILFDCLFTFVFYFLFNA
ncbi:MAG: ABC transporter permease [Candidatus Omnitrophica bacterium]|nr:ABC transporter permease [Candidatus Omnitrophota bacterium]